MSDLKEFRYLGDHAESLDGGRMIEPGGFTGPIDVSEDNAPHNAQLVAQGLLVEVPDGTHEEMNPVDDSEPETSNADQLTPPEESSSGSAPVIAESNAITNPPVASEEADDPDNSDHKDGELS